MPFVTRVEQILSKEHTEWPAVKNLKDQQNQEQEGSQSASNADNNIEEKTPSPTKDEGSPIAPPDAIKLQNA